MNLTLTLALALAFCLPARPAALNRQQPRERASESFDQLVQRAQAALETDQVPDAIRLYQRATRIRPDWSEGWWHLGTLFYDAQRFTEARDAFTHFVATEHKQRGPGFAMLGLSEFELTQYPKALAALELGIQQDLGTNPSFLREVLYHDAILNTLLGQPEVALKRLTLAANQIAAANPEAPKDAVFADLKLLDAFGIAALRIQRLPADLAPEQMPLARMAGHIQSLVALQDRVAAGHEFQELLARYGSQPGVHYMYGVFLLKEDPSLAGDEFRKEIALFPSDATPRIQLALDYLRRGEFEQGLQYAKEATKLAPDNFVAHVACGRLWMALGKTESSLQELRTAVKLAPGSPDAHFALARTLARAGRKEEATREQAEFERLKALADAANANQ